MKMQISLKHVTDKGIMTLCVNGKEEPERFLCNDPGVMSAVLCGVGELASELGTAGDKPVRAAEEWSVIDEVDVFGVYGCVCRHDEGYYAVYASISPEADMKQWPPEDTPISIVSDLVTARMLLVSDVTFELSKAYPLSGQSDKLLYCNN